MLVEKGKKKKKKKVVLPKSFRLIKFQPQAVSQISKPLLEYYSEIMMASPMFKFMKKGAQPCLYKSEGKEKQYMSAIMAKNLPSPVPSVWLTLFLDNRY